LSSLMPAGNRPEYDCKCPKKNAGNEMLHSLLILHG